MGCLQELLDLVLGILTMAHVAQRLQWLLDDEAERLKMPSGTRRLWRFSGPDKPDDTYTHTSYR